MKTLVADRTASALRSEEFPPICFIAFNRPEHTAKSLQALASSSGAINHRLYAYVDGPRNEGEKKATDEVERVIVAEQHSFRELQVVRHGRNLGMAQAIMAAIDGALESHPHCIVVEDDVIVAQSFLPYMRSALIEYEGDGRVMGVSGFFFDDVSEITGGAAFLSRRNASWGWGVWKRSWSKLRRDRYALVDEINRNERVKQFLEPPGCMSMYRKLQQGIDGSDSSWSPLWIATLALEQGLVLFPPYPLSRNIGFDGSGTHALMTDAYDVDLSAATCAPELPAKVEELPVAEEWFLQHFRESWSKRARAD